MSTKELVVQPLGSGREVGRSCHLLKFRGKVIMLDCGIHPGKRGLDAQPFFDLVDVSKIDLLLITHFHLDHVACLPHLLCNLNFKGRVFMTHPTAEVSKLLLKDYVHVSGMSSAIPGGGGNTAPEGLYTEREVNEALKRCEKIDFHQQIEVDGIKFTAYNAGHVLGACQYLIEIGGIRVLYTGDFSRENDRHLMGAECNPEWRPDVLIVESTFGVQIHPSAAEREREFVEAIDRITRRHGKCLIPVFSLGRAQELLLILEEYWANNPELQQIPIYHASRLAAQSLSIFKRFISSMNPRIRAMNDVANPWDLQHISNLERPDDFHETGPAVVLASPGMLQNGTSRRLFEQWCGDPRNGVIIAGYCVEGTLAKEILKGPKVITSLTGKKLQLNCEVKYVSFTAHSDWEGTYSYVRQLSPRHTVFVHGEEAEMKRMYDKMRHSFAREAGAMDFFMPPNGEEVRLVFAEERVAKLLGALAEKRARWEGAPVLGLLVSGANDDRLVDPQELESYTPLSATVLAQRLHVPFHSSFERLRAFVGRLFRVEIASAPNASSTSSSSVGPVKKRVLKVLDDVVLTHTYPPGSVLIEWRASPANDTVVDAIVALMMQAEAGIGGIRMSSCFHDAKRERGNQGDGDGDGEKREGGEKHDAAEVKVEEEEEEDGDEEEEEEEEEMDSQEAKLRRRERDRMVVATLVKAALEERYGAERVSVVDDRYVRFGWEAEEISTFDALTLEVETSDASARVEVERLVANAKRAVIPIQTFDREVLDPEALERGTRTEGPSSGETEAAMRAQREEEEEEENEEDAISGEPGATNDDVDQEIST